MLINFNKILFVTLIVTFTSTLKSQQVNEKWQPTLNSISAHEAPEWLKDAKLGIQFVGPPKDFDDNTCWHWTRDAQRRRELGFKKATDEEFEAIKLYGTGQLKLDYFINDEEDEEIEYYDGLMKSYEKTGAKFFVSMLLGCYPGTEGLLMSSDEVNAARKHGFEVGLHYNLLGTGKIPAIGDPGYVNWFHNKIKNEVERINADFLFFDGCQAPSSYLRTPELVAWFYNDADKKGKDVWVNDDLGNDCSEKWEYGDVLEGEGFTMSSVSPKTWMIWDMLRNEWNCWVNDFGIHMKAGEKWEWIYREPEDLLHVFVDMVSKGGVWSVQMVNTKKAWEIMWEIGDWLEINGEAIYGTRPFFEPDPECVRLPPWPKQIEFQGVKIWWWRYQQVLDVAKKQGPYYYTSKNEVAYVIHWGWPGDEIVIPGIRAKESSSVQMLGLEKDLIWQQEGENLVVRTPDEKPCKYAYCFKIHLASNH